MRRPVMMMPVPAAVDGLGLRLVHRAVDKAALMSRQRMQSATSKEREAPLKKDDYYGEETLHDDSHRHVERLGEPSRGA